MDRELKGHSYVKSPIDVALHDIVGKAFGCSVSTLLGGVCSSGGSVPLYRAISQDTPDNMVRNVDKYIAEGYRRIKQWPPKPSELKPAADGSVRLILWPEINQYADLRRHRETYRQCLGDVFTEGGWALGCDEGLWVASRKGLGLDSELADIAYGAASNKVSLHLCIQRPSGLSRVTWSSVSDAYVFHLGVTNDIRELASLGTYAPADAATAIRNLEGHSFLRLPCRGGAKWQVTEVPADWA
jgi:hypothetical protein